MKTHTPGTLGFAGQVAYSRASATSNAFTVAVTPGHLHRAGRASAGRRPATGAACTPAARSRSTRPSSSPRTTWPWPTCPSPTTAARRPPLQLRATSPYATTGSGNELTGQVSVVQQPDHALPAAVRRRLHRHQRRAEPVGDGRAPAQTVTAKVRHGLRHQRDPRVADRVQRLPGLHQRRPRSPPTCGPTTCGGRRTSRTSTSPEPAIKKNYLLPLVADAVQQPRRRTSPARPSSSRPRSRACSATTTRSC